MESKRDFLELEVSCRKNIGAQIRECIEKKWESICYFI